MMHYKKTLILNAVALVAVALGCAGCLERNMNVDRKVLSAKDFAVPADVEIGEVEYDLPVASNVSWTAELQGSPQWISASGTEHVNPSGAVDSGSVHLVFSRNDSYTERGAVLLFHAPGMPEKAVRITQRGKSDRTRIDGDGSITVIAEPTDSLHIPVLSNMFWTAEVESGATAGITLGRTSGYGDHVIGVKVDPNYEIKEEKTATIVVRGHGVPDSRITIVQGRNEPFIRLYESSSTLDVNPDKQAAKIALRINAGWTAEVVSSTLENLNLDKTSGESGWASINPTFSANEGDDPRSAVVRFALKEYPWVTFDATITQKAGTVIELTFEQGSTDWSPALPSKLKTNFSGRYKHLPTGYELVFHVLQGDAFCLFDKTSLCFCNGALAISWIELPCIEGMALSSLYLHSTNTSGHQTYYVYDSIDKDGNRGNALAANVRLSHTEPLVEEICWGETTKWTMQPEVNQSVFLYQSKQQNAKIDNITLIFTKK